jgi:hypothetical protein
LQTDTTRLVSINAGTLTFATGEMSKTFNVMLQDDLYAEPDESFSLMLAYPTVELPDYPSDYPNSINHYAPGVTYDGSGNITDDSRFPGTPARHARFSHDANGRQVSNDFSDNTGLHQSSMMSWDSVCEQLQGQ